MKKLKALILKNLINKYRGAAVAWTVGAIVSFVFAKIASGPEWIGNIVNGAMEAISQGQITELNATTLTAILTPIVASGFQAVVNAIQANNVAKIQKANGEVADGWAGEKTVKSATTK